MLHFIVFCLIVYFLYALFGVWIRMFIAVAFAIGSPWLLIGIWFMQPWPIALTSTLITAGILWLLITERIKIEDNP